MKSLYESLRYNAFLNWFVINLRYLIGFGFIPSGFKKIVGNPFTNPGQPGAFFEYLDALYATGFYYEMIGWAQVIAAILLITQRFASLGAIIFLPIIFNIMVFTLSTIGSLTPLIASLMFLGISFLVLWDYYKWINIFSSDNHLINIPSQNDYPTAGKFWTYTGILMLINPLILFLLFKLVSTDLAEGTQALIIVASSILVPITSNLIFLFNKILKKQNA